MKRILITAILILLVTATTGTMAREDVKWPATMNPIAEITVVGIDSDTLRFMGGGSGKGAYAGDFPISRTWYSIFLQNIRAGGAQVAGFNYVFVPAIPLDRADLNLARAIKAGPPQVVVGFELTPRISTKSTRIKLGQFSFPKISAASAGMVNAVNMALPYPELVEAGAAIGATNYHTDKDGVVRRASLFVKYKNMVFPSLALAIFMKTLNISPSEISVAGGGSPVMNVRGLAVKLASDYSLPLALPPQKAVFPRRSFLDVVYVKDDFKKSAVSDHNKKMREWFKDGIVIVGQTDVSLSDLKKTPAGALYPGTEIVAATVNQLLNLWARERGVSRPVWQPTPPKPGVSKKTEEEAVKDALKKNGGKTNDGIVIEKQR